MWWDCSCADASIMCECRILIDTRLNGGHGGAARCRGAGDRIRGVHDRAFSFEELLDPREVVGDCVTRMLGESALIGVEDSGGTFEMRARPVKMVDEFHAASFEQPD